MMALFLPSVILLILIGYVINLLMITCGTSYEPQSKIGKLIGVSIPFGLGIYNMIYVVVDYIKGQ